MARDCDTPRPSVSSSTLCCSSSDRYALNCTMCSDATTCELTYPSPRACIPSVAPDRRMLTLGCSAAPRRPWFPCLPRGRGAPPTPGNQDRMRRRTSSTAHITKTTRCTKPPPPLPASKPTPPPARATRAAMAVGSRARRSPSLSSPAAVAAVRRLRDCSRLPLLARRQSCTRRELFAHTLKQDMRTTHRRHAGYVPHPHMHAPRLSGSALRHDG